MLVAYCRNRKLYFSFVIKETNEAELYSSETSYGYGSIVYELSNGDTVLEEHCFKFAKAHFVISFFEVLKRCHSFFLYGNFQLKPEHYFDNDLDIF